MSTNFEKMLQKVVPEANFLTISDTKFVPGAILQSETDDIWTDHIKTILVPPFKKEDFDTEVVPGAFQLKESAGSFSGSAALSLLNVIGISIATEKEFQVKIDVDEVQVRRYKNEEVGYVKLESAFQDLRDNKEHIYKMLKRRFLVTASLYASKFRLEFNSGVGLDGDVSFNNETAAAKVGAKIQKTASGLLVSNNIVTPFAVIGYKITGSSVILER